MIYYKNINIRVLKFSDTFSREWYDVMQFLSNENRFEEKFLLHT